MLDGADGLGDYHGRRLRSSGTTNSASTKISQSQVFGRLDSIRRRFGGRLGAVAWTSAEPPGPENANAMLRLARKEERFTTT